MMQYPGYNGTMSLFLIEVRIVSNIDLVANLRDRNRIGG
jgi:hypothetical protein